MVTTQSENEKKKLNMHSLKPKILETYAEDRHFIHIYLNVN